MKIIHQYSPHGGVANNQWKGWHQGERGSRDRRALISFTIYISHSPCSSCLGNSLPHLHLCLTSQVRYHQPIHPRPHRSLNAKIWWDFYEILSSISHTGLQTTMMRIKVSCGQINLGNKARCITLSDIQNSQPHNKDFYSGRTNHSLILSSPSSSKIYQKV